MDTEQGLQALAEDRERARMDVALARVHLRNAEEAVLQRREALGKAELEYQRISAEVRIRTGNSSILR